MDEREKHIAAYKLIVLEKLAARGVTPGELGRAIKSAGGPTSLLGFLALDKLLGGVGDVAEKAWDVGSFALPFAGGAAGLGGGMLAENMFGPNEADVANKRFQEQTDALRRAALRQRVLNAANEDENDTGRHKRTPLQVHSAV